MARGWHPLATSHSQIWWLTWAVGQDLRGDSWPECLHMASPHVLSFIVTWQPQHSCVVAQGTNWGVTRENQEEAYDLSLGAT